MDAIFINDGMPQSERLIKPWQDSHPADADTGRYRWKEIVEIIKTDEEIKTDTALESPAWFIQIEMTKKTKYNNELHIKSLKLNAVFAQLLEKRNISFHLDVRLL